MKLQIIDSSTSNTPIFNTLKKENSHTQLKYVLCEFVDLLDNKHHYVNI